MKQRKASAVSGYWTCSFSFNDSSRILVLRAIFSRLSPSINMARAVSSLPSSMPISMPSSRLPVLHLPD
jgi:hypothetical protein